MTNDTPTSLQCWSCGAQFQNPTVLCPSCGKIQPAAGLNYFSLFGLSRKLTLDLAWLQKEFYRLSRRLHPDVFASASGEEQATSLAASSLLNDAYRTLKDPVKRTEYLLALESGDELKANPLASSALKPPADLLEEVFDLNMQLEEMRSGGAAAQADPELRQALVSARDHFVSLLADSDTDLGALASEWDSNIETGAPTAPLRSKLTLALQRRSYISNLVREVNTTLAPESNLVSNG